MSKQAEVELNALGEDMSQVKQVNAEQLERLARSGELQGRQLLSQLEFRAVINKERGKPFDEKIAKAAEAQLPALDKEAAKLIKEFQAKAAE